MHLLEIRILKIDIKWVKCDKKVECCGIVVKIMKVELDQ